MSEEEIEITIINILTKYKDGEFSGLINSISKGTLIDLISTMLEGDIRPADIDARLEKVGLYYSKQREIHLIDSQETVDYKDRYAKVVEGEVIRDSIPTADRKILVI